MAIDLGRISSSGNTGFGRTEASSAPQATARVDVGTSLSTQPMYHQAITTLMGRLQAEGKHLAGTENGREWSVMPGLRPNTFVVQAPYQPKTTVSSEELKQRFPTLKVAIGAK